jgi:hypothetical protein
MTKSAPVNAGAAGQLRSSKILLRHKILHPRNYFFHKGKPPQLNNNQKIAKSQQNETKTQKIVDNSQRLEID